MIDTKSKTSGIILSSYFGGYIVTQIPAGYLAGRYGVRFLYSGAIIVSSLATIAMPFVTSIHWIAFTMFQILVGLAHGTIWPCIVVIMTHWAPSNERGKLMGFVNGGAQVGIILALSISGVMCSWHFAGGWPLIFYSTGAIGFFWALLWILIYVDSPNNHTYISTIEKKFILENTQQLSNNNDRFHTPWRAILTSSVCWALFIMHTCSNWGTYTFLTSIPKYMDEVLGFDIKSNGIFSALLYASQWLSINLSGIIADMLIHKKLLSITQTRKLINILGSFLPAIFVLGLAFMTCQYRYTAVILLTIGVGLTGCCFGGGFTQVPNDIAPAHAGIIFGISNTFATIPGIISPYVVGALTEKVLIQFSSQNKQLADPELITHSLIIILRDFVLIDYLRQRQNRDIPRELLSDLSALFENISRRINDTNVYLFKQLLLHQPVIDEVANCLNEIGTDGKYLDDPLLLNSIHSLLMVFLNFERLKSKTNEYSSTRSLTLASIKCLCSSYSIEMIKKLEHNFPQKFNQGQILLSTCQLYINWYSDNRDSELFLEIPQKLLSPFTDWIINCPSDLIIHCSKHVGDMIHHLTDALLHPIDWKYANVSSKQCNNEFFNSFLI
ncbi:unnamed protein product [Rotaria magnacalcarata]|uniref:Major facilitator superfamily (MFS) profile domain-containing protein n=1 Tax=Rotaria magnacalcarata TaxID=392030 RepID=A0A819MCC6_9BILA|nr:unnamed protein product [Rotaria magnacalcarata]CAF3977339.1 unnamed protein product [Rotaria magnacalcarata]